MALTDLGMGLQRQNQQDIRALVRVLVEADTAKICRMGQCARDPGMAHVARQA